MNSYLINPDAEHRGILLIKKNHLKPFEGHEVIFDYTKMTAMGLYFGVRSQNKMP